MKTLILVRHAHALPGYQAHVNTDAERPLSDQGREKARQTALEIAKLGYTPEAVLASPLLRALQTADILAKQFNAPVSRETELNGFHSDREVCEFLAGQMKDRDCLLAVGHNPNISMTAHLLTKTLHSFAPGSFMVLNFDNPHKPEPVHFGA